MKDIIRKILKEERNRKFKVYSRDPEYRAEKRAKQDIKTHLYKVNDPWAPESGKPSDEWPKHSLPYDTEFFFDDLTEQEDLDDEDESDHPSFDEVYRNLWDKMLYSVCMKYTKDLDKAKEYCQLGFMKVMNNLDKYKRKGSIESWVRRIITNNTLDQLRKEKNNKELNSDVDWERVNMGSKNDTPYSEDYFFDEKRYTKEDLHRGLSRLSPKYREVITKYFIEGLTHEEIADEMGINIGTSKSNLHKAKKNLLDIIRK